MKPEDLIGTRIDRYHLETLVGTGGVSAVYRALDAASGEQLAIKVLFPPPGAGSALGQRFRREARMAAQLDHPGIVRVHDAGQAGSLLFMTMPLVEGASLQQVLEARGRLDEGMAADIAGQVAEALDYAHARGVIHRDVKPSNILVDLHGQALLVDFGVARALDDPALTVTGFTVGTPAYMAPEQASSSTDLDGRADLYSLGVVLYQAVTGRIPFRGSTPQVMHAHVYELPPPPSSVAEVSSPMEAIILRALAKNPDDRYATGAMLAADLQSLVETTRTRLPIALSETAKSRGRATRLPDSRRSPWLSTRLAQILLTLLVIVIIGGGLWQAIGGSVILTPSPGPEVPATAELLASSPTPVPRSPTATLPESSLGATQASPGAPPGSLTVSATPSATSSPTPIPVTTPGPSPSPLPTSTPTPVLPTPPPTPTPTACPVQVASAFAGWLASDASLAARVGCPRDQGTQAVWGWEPFERGQMLWRGDLSQVYVLYQAGTWAVYDDEWREGDLEWDGSIIPPIQLHQPVRGFGLVWRQNLDVRDALGWATAPEISFSVSFQPFERALLAADDETSRMWALLADGTLAVRK